MKVSFQKVSPPDTLDLPKVYGAKNPITINVIIFELSLIKLTIG